MSHPYRNDNTLAPLLLAPPTPLEGALDMARLGWRVLPLVRRQKGPIAGFTDYFHRASSDEKKILAWEEKSPGCNWGIILEDGYMVVDVDAKPGKPNGPVNWRCFQASHAPLPEAPIVWSGAGNGACHMYFRLPEGLQGATARRYEAGPFAGMDVFGTGRYLVCPGSIHPDTGNVYSHDPVHNFGTVALPIAPEWFLRLLETEQARLKKKAAQESGARRLSPDSGKNPDGSLLVKGKGAREKAPPGQEAQGEEGGQEECAKVVSPKTLHLGTQPTETPYGAPLRELLSDPANVPAINRALGLPEATQPFQAILCPLHDESHPSATRLPEGIYCHHEGLYVDQVTLFCWQHTRDSESPLEQDTDFLGKPALAVWAARLCLAAGLYVPPAVPVPPLPEDAPEDARALLEGLVHLQKCRARTREADAPMPLSRRFVAQWMSWGRYRVQQALAYLREAGILLKDGIFKRGRGLKKLTLWTLGKVAQAGEALMHAAKDVLKDLAATFPVPPPDLDTLPGVPDPAHRPGDEFCDCRDCEREADAWLEEHRKRTGYGLEAVP